MQFLIHALCLILFCASWCSCFPLAEWDAWKQKYNKHYTSSEEEHRHRQIWYDHYQMVHEHNSRGDRTFDMEMNEFADQILPRNGFQEQLHYAITEDVTSEALLFAPSSWDWRTKGAISPVRNQGQLGDAVAIAGTECVESYEYIQSGKLERLSFGEMHDCCTHRSVLSADIFQCVHNIGGLCSIANYPASANICRNTTCTPVAKVNGGSQSPSGNEQALLENVYKVPVLVGVDASHSSFQLYRAGIYSEPECTTTKIDHAMQLVGYGTQDGQDYWICKNSWGTNWGDKGYILIARNKSNMCGIATTAIYPV